MEGFPEEPRRVRPEIAAIPLIVAATFTFRAKSLVVGVGADEFSLLAMAEVIREGGFPYASFWDVRPPLAYLWGLPSAFIEDAATAIKTLRLMALFAQGITAWLFFCLFRRQLGSLAAALGTVALLASVNMAELHHLAVPNHFAMTMSLGGFACVVEGVRRNSRPMYYLSALLAGVLPWMMVHAALAALAIAALAVLGAWSKDRRWAWTWLAIASLPTVAVVGAYALWGPFDVFVRTVLLAPIDFVMEGLARGTWFSLDRETTGLSPAMLHYVVLLVVGIPILAAMVRKASPGSPLRLSPYLILPPVLPLVLMGYIKNTAPEYWIDAAPAAALLVAASVYGLFSWNAWTAFAGNRYLRPSVLRGCVSIYIGLVLFLLTGPGKEKPEPALPPAYCEAAAGWIEQLEPGATVLDTSSLCSYWMLKSNARLHPPFTFTDHWFRQLHMRWIGEALSGDGAESTSAERFAAAIGPASAAGIILADGRIYDEIRERDWRTSFFRHWRLVWFRSVDGYGPGDRFSTLAIFVRRDTVPRAGSQWP
ncbi:MAG: hypothetical protein OXP28_11295 [Gammaproteobacteria bacterium]|nr:hypothetical protein [Gammaproteobacteria bacterium]